MIHEPCVILKPEMVTIHPTARIDSFTKIEGGQGVTIGERCHIASFSHLNAGGGELVFGDFSGCSSGVIIATGNPDLRYLRTMPTEPAEHIHVIRKRTVIGEYAIIFAGAILLPGIRIGEGAVIGAGAVVTKDVPAWEFWAGNPAKFIRMREITNE